MKTPLPKLAFVFLLLLPLLGRAQETRITGRVVDAATKKPIPFVSVGLLKADTGALTNEKGCFEVGGLLKSQQDTLIFTAMAYNRKAVLVERKQIDSLRIEMTGSPYGLAVSPKPCEVVGKRGVPLAKGEIIRGVPGTQYAFFIGSANQNRYGIMRELAIYSGGNGFPKGRFRLHIYEANNAHSAPGGELLNEDIVLLPRPCEGWDNWDLSTFNIPVSEIGYFIAVEFVTQDEQFDYLFADYYPLYQVMRPPVKAKEQSIWNYSRTEGWKELPPTGNISYQYNTMLKVFVERAR